MVLATTLRLWTTRRLRKIRRRIWPRQPRRRVAVVVTAVAALLVAAAVTVGLTRASHPGTHAAAGGTGQLPHGPRGTALAIAAATRGQAAAWVASQVSGEAIVACDPAVCAGLQAKGVPASRLLVLRPGQLDPLGSDIVLATAAVRSEFGTRLVSVYAPITLAVFGTGAARIEIRVVAPNGGAAYLSALASDLRDRKVAGSQLAKNPHVHTSAAVRGQLTAGLADSRLLVALAGLAALHPLDILSFGPPSRAASAGVPLRSADIAPATAPGSHPASLSVLRRFLLAQRPPYLPSALRVVRIGPHRGALGVTYPAPSPLGLLGSRG